MKSTRKHVRTSEYEPPVKKKYSNHIPFISKTIADVFRVWDRGK